jgi:beta-glucosidase
MRVWMSALAALFVLAVTPLAQTPAPGSADRASTATVAPDAPFRNPDLPADQRLADLIARLTPDEKIAALGTNPAVPRLGIAGARHVEGLHGLAYGGPSNWGSRNPMPTTIFPQAVGLGETWDVNALRLVGHIEGDEARFIFQSPRWNRGGLIVRAPNADLARDPRWGRTEESYGEDPFLTGSLAVAMIQGLQGDDPKYWQAAALMKHLLANSNENDRERSSSDFDERLLREYYSVPFRMGVMDGHANAFMAAYNKVNGTACMVQPFLRAMTMTDWGLDGIICTDGGALGLLVSAHHSYPSVTEGAAATIKAGITVFLDRYPEPVKQALDQGLITWQDIDAALIRNFRVSLKLGLLDPPDRVPYARVGLEGDDPWKADRRKADVRQVTRESIVLLKNDRHLLPIDPTRVKSIAVIGPRASDVLLDWYSGTPPYTVSPLDGIREAAGDRVKVWFAADNAAGSAAALAKAADLAIVIVGNHPTCNAGWQQCPVASDGKEAVDRKSIDLEQESLVREVYAANKRTVVVLKASFPFAINWSQAHVPAILTMAHNSQEEGHAMADVLFGAYNPAGRLVHTWPKSAMQLPPMMDYDIRHGRTYMYAKDPLYPFGFGLSYTTFQYGKLSVPANAIDASGSATVSIQLKNTGTRDGDEVVQLYASYPASKVARPMKQLIGFARVSLKAGEQREVGLTIPASRLAYWDVERHGFTVEPGSVRLTAGGSSADAAASATLEIARTQ